MLLGSVASMLAISVEPQRDSWNMNPVGFLNTGMAASVATVVLMTEPSSQKASMRSCTPRLMLLGQRMELRP